MDQESEIKNGIKFDFEKASKILRESLENMTPKDIEKYFPKDTKPKGWLNIEEHLPMFMAVDIEKGCSVYTVKFADGTIGQSGVADHNTWYYEAKNAGITHWYNE